MTNHPVRMSGPGRSHPHGALHNQDAPPGPERHPAISYQFAWRLEGGRAPNGECPQHVVRASGEQPET